MTTRSFLARPPVALRASVLAVAAAFPMSGLAATAATVEFVIGNAVAMAKSSGQSRNLTKGATVDSGDTIYTNSGRVQLRFTDRAYVSLQPQSEFVIKDYQFNGKADGTERGFFSLLKGGLRTITGLVGRTNKKNYQVETTVATIGIRGTEYTIAYTGSITGSVGGGEIDVCNSVACVAFGSGQSFHVSSSDSRPVLTKQKTDLPPTQPREATPSFVSGDQTGSDGTSNLFVLTGTQTLNYARVSQFSSPTRGLGTVVLDSAGAILSTPTSDMVTSTDYNDGIIAFGRGTSLSSGELIHIVVGLPTSASDILTMKTAGTVATYSYLPNSGSLTAFNSSGIQVAGAITGASAVLKFGPGPSGGSAVMDLTLLGKIDNGGLTLTATSEFGPNGLAPFSAPGACSANGSSNCTVNAILAGPNASRIGVITRGNSVLVGSNTYDFIAGAGLGKDK